MMYRELKSIKEMCEKTIALQEKMRKSYFWSPPSIASLRRNYEENNSQDFCFEYNGKTYKFIQSTSCSCKHIYFFSRFLEDDVVKDLRLVKKVLREVDEELNKTK